MAYYTVNEARDAFRRRNFAKSAQRSLSEGAAGFRSGKYYDVFLSHCMKDAEAIAGVKELLEAQDLSVYVDWIEDRDLNRERVTAETAATLRERMDFSHTLMFASSTTSSESKWMPWELGYFDGLRHGRIAIFPLVASPDASFLGQEYLGLYPKIQKLEHTDGTYGMYVTNGPGTYMPLGDFKAGKNSYKTYS